MKKVMLQFKAQQEQPSLESVKQQFKLSDEAIDKEFGVIETDSTEHLYVVMVDAGQQARIEKILARKAAKHPAEGFFSNPPIKPI
ncbi:hypothetical protein [Spirosoma montaniterrae]|uniref:Uncharacterized protein n=1 Tax=Spirosoma montaniterrae TaxID=1178516 RepID=A0A1P9WY14_9BACT|nr:hypothetical protein [Spirosoma montaniterrae]AQG80277.1 hypothetical protein AWR27_13695 [Spirosoma montaniterrae]